MRFEMAGEKSGDTVGRNTARRRLSAGAFALVVVALTLATAGAVGSARAAAPSSSFGALPYNYNIQSRCEGLHVANHVVFSGKDVVATASPGICGGPPENTFGWGVDQVAGSGMHNCGENSTHCSFKVGSATDAYGLVCISGSNQQGAWQSCDYYAVVGKSAGVIEGHVLDKDGSPVAGVDVTAYGTSTVSTTTGTDGYYAMQVKPGSYRVVPSGGPHGKSPAVYLPKVNTTTIAPGTSGTADFALQAGIELQLHFDQKAVPADGLHVVNGTITTTEFGKPVSVGVQLQGMPNVSPTKAVTSGPLASVCGGGTRVWPSGTLQSPDGSYVTVTTDATGHYAFAITVGTTPGVWSLNAWAKNTNGTLSTDSAAASDTQSLTLDRLPGPTTALSMFDTEFDRAAKTKTTGLDQISASSNTMVNLLAQTNATKAIQTLMGGFAFALVNAKDGQSVLVFPAARPPVISPAGEIVPVKANAGDLVIDPAEWTGAGLPSTVTNAASLQFILDSGLLQTVPTLSEFVTGKTVVGWKTVSGNAITLFQPTFQYLGWGYAGGIAAAGSCY